MVLKILHSTWIGASSIVGALTLTAFPSVRPAKAYLSPTLLEFISTVSKAVIISAVGTFKTNSSCILIKLPAM